MQSTNKSSQQNEPQSIPRVDFMVPGFSKCGTTTLCDLLTSHPDIYIPPTKENNFFINDNYEQRWSDYRGFYRDAGDQKMIGEGSTFYSGSISEKKARSNILKHYPNIKLIFIARDPFDRLESSFREFHHSGSKFGVATPFEIDKALQKLPNMLTDTLYWSRLNNYLEYVPAHRLHILFLEELKENPEKELRKCFQFLDVDPDIEIKKTERQLNSGSSKLYDTRFLRRIRQNDYMRSHIRKIPFEKQIRFFRSTGLMRPFGKSVEWSGDSKEWLMAKIEEDITRFLEHTGKPSAMWPRFHRALKSMSDS